MRAVWDGDVVPARPVGHVETNGGSSGSTEDAGVAGGIGLLPEKAGAWVLISTRGSAPTVEAVGRARYVERATPSDVQELDGGVSTAVDGGV